jgi:hypothetical protein
MNEMANRPDQQWFTLKEASIYLRLSTRSLMRAMASGKIRRNKANGRYLFQRKWLDTYACGYGLRLSKSQKYELIELLR